MTTTVTVQAHCPADIEVVVVQLEVPPKNLPAAEYEKRAQDIVLQDGQSHSAVVYDSKQIVVYERKKT